jgi:hypothetical protein
VNELPEGLYDDFDFEFDFSDEDGENRSDIKSLQTDGKRRTIHKDDEADFAASKF